MPDLFRRISGPRVEMSMAHVLGMTADCDMGKSKPRDLPDLAALAVEGAQIAVRVTAKAARNSLTVKGDHLRVAVTVAPENGKANAAVQALLAAAMGVAPSYLALLRGQTGRDKVFVYLGVASRS